MSVRITIPPGVESFPPPSNVPSGHGSDSDSSSDDDQTWDDWESDPSSKQKCQSLFDSSKAFSTAEEALIYDRSVHGVDLDAICERLCARRTPE